MWILKVIHAKDLYKSTFPKNSCTTRMTRRENIYMYHLHSSRIDIDYTNKRVIWLHSKIQNITDSSLTNIKIKGVHKTQVPSPFSITSKLDVDFLH